MFKTITPKFVQRFDSWLLTNHPVLWMSKIHYALWHGLVLWALSALLGAIMPVNLKNQIQYELWYFLFTVLGVVMLCFWTYQYVIFNKERDYGSKKFSEEYKNFILVFFSVGIFLLVPWPFEVVYSQRIAALYSDSEVLEDMNILNERDPYMANSTNNYYSWYDSITKVQYLNMRQLNPYAASYFTPYFMKSDSAKYPQLLTDFQLYKKYKPIVDIHELKRKVEEFRSIAAKYGCPIQESTQTIAEKYKALLVKERVAISEFYGNDSYQYELNVTFTNLCDAKFKTFFIFTKDYMWVMFYFIICTTSFLLLFKVTYWRQYLVMLVVLMLYPLLMFIFSQLLPYHTFTRGAGFFECSMVVLVVFSGSTLFVTAFSHHCYRAFYNIANQVFYVSLIFVPLLILAFLHDNTDIFHNHSSWNYEKSETPSEGYGTTYDSHLANLYYTYWSNEFNRWIDIMKYTGIALFIIGLPFFKQLFVKQLSLPKKN
ncbi:MAG: hypothetical protein H0W61_12335 [Bacteroidetes bacterium]|nr:hypothetical protein [Bacteroidota bacterium]